MQNPVEYRRQKPFAFEFASASLLVNAKNSTVLITPLYNLTPKCGFTRIVLMQPFHFISFINTSGTPKSVIISHIDVPEDILGHLWEIITSFVADVRWIITVGRYAVKGILYLNYCVT